MPSRWSAILIVLIWLGTTTALVRRDLLPRFGMGEVTYRSFLAERVVHESARWTILLDDKKVGSLISETWPQKDGGVELSNRTELAGSLIDTQEKAATSATIHSRFMVSALGRLESFRVELRLGGSSFHFDLNGVVSGREVVIKTNGVPLIPESLTFSIEPEMLIFDKFGPIDKLSGLRVGQSWSTRTIDPLAAISGPGNLLGGGEIGLDFIQHRVVGKQTLNWNGKQTECFLVEHRQGDTIARGWFRADDGRAIRQQIPIGRLTLTMQLEAIDGEAP